jgi:uncharacterized protein YdhG (YjbR/CyaY superfamily)
VPIVTVHGARGRAKIRAYLKAMPPLHRARMLELRKAIQSAAPKAKEVYRLDAPGFDLDDWPLVGYSAWRNWVSLYPSREAIAKLPESAFGGRVHFNGTVRFALDEPIAAKLVQRLVKERIPVLREEKHRDEFWM